MDNWTLRLRTGGQFHFHIFWNGDGTFTHFKVAFVLPNSCKSGGDGEGKFSQSKHHGSDLAVVNELTNNVAILEASGETLSMERSPSRQAHVWNRDGRLRSPLAI